MESLLVIGAGSIGQRHIGLFSKRVRDIAIVDPIEEKRSQANEKFGITKLFKSIDEALNYQKYDIAAICTPPHVHLDAAEKCAHHGAHLFIEKPLGIGTSGWADLSMHCSQKGLVNYVAYCHRFIPYTDKLIEIVGSGRIGRVVHANLRWGSYLPDWHPWEDYRTYFMSRKEEGGGALSDESHGIDLMRYVLGEIVGVSAIVDTVSDLEITSDDVACLNLRLKSRAIAQINFDIQARYPRINFEIVGTEGTVIWDRVEHRVSVYDSERKSWEIFQFNINDLLAMYSNQASHFLGCVEERASPRTDIQDAMKTQHIINQSFISSNEGRYIEISME
jgi:predicted dehydrogenase